jgi:16S rRNA (uracil1498-N3)-methyltransferase
MSLQREGHFYFLPHLNVFSHMHIFYTPDIGTATYTLSEEESKHCIRVLRLKTGDQIQLVDGKGGWHLSEIVDDHPKRCSVSIISKRQEEKKRSWQLHIAIAPTKNMDRLEWFVEKATETGIDRISLLDCDTSERTIVKTERLERVAVSAMKQSMSAWLPVISEMTSFKSFVKELDKDGPNFIAHCHSREQLPHLKTVYKKGTSATVMIGPEGDFSGPEIEMAKAVGCAEIGLGSSRLRTETAALYACTALNILNE